MLIFYYSVLFLLLLFLFCFFLLFYYSVFSFWYFFYFIKKKCVTILCYVYFTILFSFYHFCCYFILELRRLIICSYIQNVFLWDENYCWEYRIKHQDYCNAWHWKHWTKWRYPCSCEKTGPWHSWFDSWPIKLVLFQPDEALLTRSSGLKDLTLYVLVTLVQVKPGAV